MAQTLRVFNCTRNTWLVSQGQVASNLWTRLVGLMGKRALPQGFGLLLRNETAIHTFGMRIPIDVLYIDAQGKILRMTNAMPPAKIGPLVHGVQDVLELPVGTLTQSDTHEGDQLELTIV
ncbi:MAG TPA: DUF192 domain-containing protein [Anaerolineae bacterium]|nr:DUF192 domain-containing protein [Anaerolineae bacterium]